MNWSEINQKVVGGTLSGLVLVACLGLFTYTNTRASTDSVEALENQHKEDTEASEAADEALKERSRLLDWKVTSIAILLNRMDKENGGEGMPMETMRRSP